MENFMMEISKMVNILDQDAIDGKMEIPMREFLIKGFLMAKEYSGTLKEINTREISKMGSKADQENKFIRMETYMKDNG